MIPRDELTSLLRTRLGKLLSQHEIDDLAVQILAIDDEWEEMDVPHRDMGYVRSDLCSSICWLANQCEEQGAVIRFQRRKKP
jgi:hypothetical protein